MASANDFDKYFRRLITISPIGQPDYESTVIVQSFRYPDVSEKYGETDNCDFKLPMM